MAQVNTIYLCWYKSCILSWYGEFVIKNVTCDFHWDGPLKENSDAFFI